ncbi:hypothetical protein CSKR_110588 [Clonorchis sinensis]|uniref:Uncharacterized protein n=1 Tax=Clonorchis sinensis TaxID=79923 RepID=A0A8T1MSW4_CLOSI|nr:hypothetical protein CSKR_110588 [Clonorchis sinensis]
MLRVICSILLYTSISEASSHTYRFRTYGDKEYSQCIDDCIGEYGLTFDARSCLFTCVREAMARCVAACEPPDDLKCRTKCQKTVGTFTSQKGPSNTKQT